MNYIGVDCHISTLEFAVVDRRGKLKAKASINTSAKGFMEFVKKVPKPRKIFIEEGILASWLLETSLKHGEKLVITDPKTNKWIGKSGVKDDEIDAKKLANLARGGFYKEIYHPVHKKRRFKELVFAYHDTVNTQIRIKNKLKARFRTEGIKCSGNTVYSEKYRNEWREKLPESQVAYLIVDELWSQLDQLQESKKRLKGQIEIQSKQYPEIRRFMKIPGIGLINASTIFAIVDTPDRFANKKKLWMYAGIGLSIRASGGTVYSKKLTREYNRQLKNAVKKSAESAIHARESQFRRQHLRLTIKQGLPSHKAKLTVARSLLATVYGIWKSGEEYDPDIAKKRSEGNKK